MAMKVATSNRGRHTSREEWAMSGNDAQYDANSAVLVAAKQKAALQERGRPRGGMKVAARIGARDCEER